MNNLDLFVVFFYFIGITAYGLWISRRTRTSDGYFMGGHKLKWWTMMGQAFGTGTHAEMPVGLAGASFANGFSTIWYQWKNMLITPFYWFMAPWYRRSERTTIAGMMTDRYGKAIGLFYTIYAVLFFVFTMGVMLMGAAKVISIATGGSISPEGVVVGMTVAFMVYSFVGGLVASAHTEFIQSFLIIVLSFMLIPAGLSQVGGLSAMREALPPDFFLLFSDKSGLTSFTILMLAINGIVGITAQPHMMTMFASGDTEYAGRVGQTYGTFVKRLVTIGWAFTGLVVAALVIKTGTVLEDPEHAFGYATRTLLGPGLTGLMIACILAANMSTCSNFMVNLGALFTRDIYQTYINPDISDKRALFIGRVSGLGLTLAGVGFALIVENVLAAFLFVETISAFIGIMILGGILWKRANRYGAFAAVMVSYILYYILNYYHAGKVWSFIYAWEPEPFGWAFLGGVATLIVVSLLTPAEEESLTNAFFTKMESVATIDRKEGEPIEADKLGRGLILLDAPGWFRKGRWDNFLQRYREDWWGFWLAWVFVGLLIVVAWAVLQL
ncbi:MAG: sodium:solute symporter family protein [Bacteroidia bacterium]|nr:sodium:solute symporter family protein [Bacteroidia bacterium]